MDDRPFETPGEAAFAVLMAHREGVTSLSRRAGSFVGETIVDPSPLSVKQVDWLQKLLEKANLPLLAVGESQ